MLTICKYTTTRSESCALSTCAARIVSEPKPLTLALTRTLILTEPEPGPGPDRVSRTRGRYS